MGDFHATPFLLLVCLLSGLGEHEQGTFTSAPGFKFCSKNTGSQVRSLPKICTVCGLTASKLLVILFYSFSCVRKNIFAIPQAPAFQLSLVFN